MKTITLTIVSIFLFGFVNAQEKSEMSFGIKAGVNISDITKSPGSKTLVGFNGGFFGEFMIGDKFAIQPEVLYSGQGAEYNEGKLKLGYINVPVLAKYYILDSFSIEVGPQAGFLVSAKADGDDVKDSLKDFDVSVDFGATYDITKNFLVNARYNLGLTRLQDDLFPGESSSKNSVFQFSVGYRF